MYGARLIPAHTVGMFFLSPALKVSKYIRNLTSAMRAIKVSGYVAEFFRLPMMGKAEKYKSTYAETQVRELSQFVLSNKGPSGSRQKTIKEILNSFPVHVVDTDKDNVVPPAVNKKYFSEVKTATYSLIPKSYNVKHGETFFLNPEVNKWSEFLKNDLDYFLNRLP